MTPAPHWRTNRFGRALLTAAALTVITSGVRSTVPEARAQSAARAQLDPLTAAITGDSLRIYLMTIGAGDGIWELFGHNAIWVHDPSRVVDTVYNWGVFNFDHPVTFVLKFMKGDMHYGMAADRLDQTIGYYQHFDRTIWAQELNLTPAEKKQLIDFVHWNVRPENATYRYDYYRDNCSTRVRDAIDRVVGGAIRAKLTTIKTDETYRSHTLRLMQQMEPIVSGVELLLGRPTDKPLSAEETSFLPVQLMKHIQTVKLDGGARNLVGPAFVVYQAKRAPEPTNVPNLWKGLLAIGLALAALILWLGAPASASRGRRRALAFVVAAIAGIFGLLGLIITLLVTVTDHVAAHGNENITMLNPLWLAIAVVAPSLILNARPSVNKTGFVLGCAALGLVAVLIHLVGLSRQPNWDVIGLVLPAELAIAWVVLRLSE